MSDVLDLDALLPEPKKIKINGKLIDCYPPKVKHLISMQRVFARIQNAQDTDEAEKLIEDVLAPIIPAIREDDTIDFTLDQLKALLQFAQNAALRQDVEPTQAVPSQKKTDSPNP